MLKNQILTSVTLAFPMSKKRILNKEVRMLMIGFGDASSPVPESVNMMEDLLLDFITQWSIQATKISAYAKPKTTGIYYYCYFMHNILIDFMHVIRKDEKKYTRARELISMDKELKQARETFDVKDMA